MIGVQSLKRVVADINKYAYVIEGWDLHCSLFISVMVQSSYFLIQRDRVCLSVASSYSTVESLGCDWQQYDMPFSCSHHRGTWSFCELRRLQDHCFPDTGASNEHMDQGCMMGSRVLVLRFVCACNVPQ